jgi:hypothetical protein
MDMKGLFTYFRATMFFFWRTYDPATFGKEQRTSILCII